MKKLLSVALVALSLSFSACQMTPQKQAVTTLASVGLTANTAYEAYLSGVLSGSIPTNYVPKVTAYYRDFQASFGVAESAARFATNTTFASPDLINALTRLQTAIAVVTKK